MASGGRFEADVSAMVKKTKNNMSLVVRASLQDVVDLAQLPVAKGGRMRVDTGFLRASGQGSFSGMPTGPVRGEVKVKFHYDNGGRSTTIVELSSMQIGSTFYFGWTAEYAKYREAYDGFLETAVQRWPEIVNKRIEQINKVSATR